MKKLLAILAVVMVATSCEGPMGPQGPAGTPNRESIPITVFYEDWIREPATGPTVDYFYCVIDMPELTYRVLTGGLYYTYCSWGNNNGLIQEGTGYTIYHREEDGRLWEQTIACDYRVGEMTFYVRNSDFNPNPPDYDMDFRFVALW